MTFLFYSRTTIGESIMRLFKSLGSNLALILVFGGMAVACQQNALGQGNAAQDYLLVTSFNNNSIYRYDAATGNFVDVFVPRRSGGMVQPWACIFSPYDGSFLVSAGHFVPGQFMGVLQYDGETGAFSNRFTPSVTMPHAITFGPDGNLYLGDRLGPGGQGLISRYDGLTGEFVDDFVACRERRDRSSLGSRVWPKRKETPTRFVCKRRIQQKCNAIRWRYWPVYWRVRPQGPWGFGCAIRPGLRS